MGLNIRLFSKFAVIKRKIASVLLSFLSLAALSLPAQAFEIGVTGYQVSEQSTQGYSISISDNFSRRSPYYWSVGLSRYDDLAVEWNNSELAFPLSNVEAALSYRQKFTSRNLTMRRVSMEYQIGIATSLTDNKFSWPELEQEKFFSETGDINGFLAISGHYKVSANLSANLGLKHFPDMSEFGSVSSISLGLTVKFGQNRYGQL